MKSSSKSLAALFAVGMFAAPPVLGELASATWSMMISA